MIIFLKNKYNVQKCSNFFMLLNTTGLFRILTSGNIMCQNVIIERHKELET